MATVAENNKKGKKGRPDIYTKHYGEIAGTIKAQRKFAYESNVESKRGENDAFYRIEATMLLMDNDTEAFKRDYVTPKGKFRYSSVLIQIGRMYMQDNFTPEECIEFSEKAIKLIHEGRKVHQVAQMIRNHRLLHKVSSNTK